MGQNQAGIGGKETGIIFLPANEVLEYKDGLLNHHISGTVSGYNQCWTTDRGYAGENLRNGCQQKRYDLFDLYNQVRSGVVGYCRQLDEPDKFERDWCPGMYYCWMAGFRVGVPEWILCSSGCNRKKKNGFVENEVVWKDEN